MSDQHYKMTTIQPIDIIDEYELNFSMGNAIKYILRADFKQQKDEDLRKAITYLAFELRRSNKEYAKNLAESVLKLTN